LHGLNLLSNGIRLNITSSYYNVRSQRFKRKNSGWER
jgi:hypothetical protein